MSLQDHQGQEQSAIRTDLGAIFVSMELSRSAWLITSLSPGAGEKMSRRSVVAGDVAGLAERFADLKRRAAARTGRDFPIIIIQEAGLDGFWIHRVLRGEGIESHVVDAASILTSRRRRRAKTDRIDGETLVRTLMATGRPGYHPAVLLKIYVYGYINQVSSSRPLEREAHRNVELMWLTGRLAPDSKTIADFRKDSLGL